MIKSFHESEIQQLKNEHGGKGHETVIAVANAKGKKLILDIDDEEIIVGLKPLQTRTAPPRMRLNEQLKTQESLIRQAIATDKLPKPTMLNTNEATNATRYEAITASNQQLTFSKTTDYFLRKEILFGKIQQKTLGMISNDNTYTNLALLLSDQLAHAIKLLVFHGNGKTDLTYQQEFCGSMLNQLEEAYVLIDKYNKTALQAHGLYQTATRSYPEVAIREALLNAVVHREYSIATPTTISLFNDRLEISNAGALEEIATLTDITQGLSSLRNPALASAFRRLELIKAYGTGLPKIMEAYADYQMQPTIKLEANIFKITLPNVNYQNLTNQPASPENLPEASTKRANIVLKLLAEQPFVTRKEVEKILEVSQATAINLLRELIENELIQSHGRARNLKYSLRSK